MNSITGSGFETAMFREAHEAPEAVRRLLGPGGAGQLTEAAADFRARPPRAVVTLARGSSDNAATYARYLIETRLGLLTSSAAPSVSSVYDAHPDFSGTLFLAISQSGRSPDLIAGLKAAKASGARTLAIVNDAASPLAEAADFCIDICAGPEHSVAATKTYIATNAAIAALVAQWSGDQAFIRAVAALPDTLAESWDMDWSAALEVLEPATDLYAIGRGVGFGAAQEAALKLKETCALHGEAFSAAEVRHGPMALAKDGFPVLALSQDDETRPGFRDLITTMTESGCKVLLAGFDAPGAVSLPFVPAYAAVQPILQVESFYRMAEHLSRKRGLNPDKPVGLKKVTETV